MRLMNNANILPETIATEQSIVTKFSTLIDLVLNGKINRSAYKETIEAVFLNNAEPEKYIAEKGLLMVNDDNAVTEAVDAVITENQDSVTEYRTGKEKVFGFLMGQVMKKLGKGGNPEIVKKVLEKTLKEGAET
jgi:aspartyl-tRNA(Asn)/glutamyl-tRNA(Gln) amidotransferase subunit B